jgi:hypothetical protein
MVGLAAGRDDVCVRDLEQRRRVARQCVGAAFEPAAEGGELDVVLLQRAIREQPDVVVHPFPASFCWAS